MRQIRITSSILFFVFLTSFTVYANANSDKSNLILGRWKNEAGIVEYFKDGTFMLHTATGEYKKKAGKWNIYGDVLTLRFYIHPKPYKYKILELSTSKYKIVGFDVDKGTYNASRIDSSKQFSVYVAKESRTYHRKLFQINYSKFNRI